MICKLHLHKAVIKREMCFKESEGMRWTLREASSSSLTSAWRTPTLGHVGINSCAGGRCKDYTRWAIKGAHKTAEQTHTGFTEAKNMKRERAGERWGLRFPSTAPRSLFTLISRLGTSRWPGRALGFGFGRAPSSFQWSPSCPTSQAVEPIKPGASSQSIHISKQCKQVNTGALLLTSWPTCPYRGQESVQVSTTIQKRAFLWHFCTPKWHNAKKQLPFIFMGKFMSIPSPKKWPTKYA